MRVAAQGRVTRLLAAASTPRMATAVYFSFGKQRGMENKLQEIRNTNNLLSTEQSRPQRSDYRIVWIIRVLNSHKVTLWT